MLNAWLRLSNSDDAVSGRWDFRKLNYPVLYSSLEECVKAECPIDLICHIEFVNHKQILNSILAAYSGNVNTSLDVNVLGFYQTTKQSVEPLDDSVCSDKIKKFKNALVNAVKEN